MDETPIVTKMQKVVDTIVSDISGIRTGEQPHL